MGLRTVVRAANENSTELLALARQYRDGLIGQVNLARANNYYEFVIEGGDPLHLPEALYELSNLLQTNPQLSTRYTSFNLLVRAADQGHREAQHKLAIAYSTGVGPSALVPMDASRALLLEYFSALSGHPEAAMGMGYRFLTGIGVTASCETAQQFYEYAANEAAEFLDDQGYATFIDRMKLSDSVDPAMRKSDTTAEVVDWYVHLAESKNSEAAVWLGNIYSSGTRLIPADEERAIYFYTLGAAEKNPHAAGYLGYLMAKRYQRHYEKHVEQQQQLDQRGAMDQFLLQHSTEEVTLEYASSEAEAESPMDAFFANTTRIHELLSFAAAKNDASGGVGMGFLHMHGIHVPRNYTAALELFSRFINHHSDAGYYIGEIHMGDHGRSSVNIHNAIQGYTMSSSMGNILATHRVAQMTARGMGTTLSCAVATAGYKSVAEKGPWAQRLNRAHQAFMNGRKQESLAAYASLAAIGYEVAQYNAAYLLSKVLSPPLLQPTEEDVAPRFVHFNASAEARDDVERAAAEASAAATLASEETFVWENVSTKVAYLSPHQWGAHIAAATAGRNASGNLIVSSRSRNRVAEAPAVTSRQECEQRALMLFALSAAQGNSESFLQLGDFNYYGSAGLPVSHLEAAVYYQRAADLKHTQAIFNLGLMHEVGDGVSQDFHLAKRYYDQAAEVDPKARVVRDIALSLLEAHKSLDELMGLEATGHLLAAVGLDKSNYMESVTLGLSLLKEYDAALRGWLDGVVAARQSQIAALREQTTALLVAAERWLAETTGYDKVLSEFRAKLAEVKAQSSSSNSGIAGIGMRPTNARKTAKEKVIAVSVRDVETAEYLLLVMLVSALMGVMLVKYVRLLRRAGADAARVLQR